MRRAGHGRLRADPASSPGLRTFVQEIPYFRLAEAMPDPFRRLVQSMPVLKPVIPDPGARFRSCTRTTWRARSPPRCAAAASPGRTTSPSSTLTLADVAQALDWYTLPVPKPLAGRHRRRHRRGCRSLPDSVAWIHSVKKPVLMKDGPCPQGARLAAQAHGQGHPEGDDRGRARRGRGALERLRKQLGVLFLARLARVQQGRAVPHRALHERRDAGLGHPRLRVASVSRAARRGQ